MYGTSELQTLNEQGWRVGFANLVRRERTHRWSPRNVLIQSIIWLVLLNFVLAMLLETEASMDTMGMSTGFFIAMIGVLAPIGMVVAAQGAIVGEKSTGTAAWILSKPATRTAFIMSKFVTIAVGFLAIVIVLQGVIAYSQLSIAKEVALPVIPFLGAMTLLSLNVLFYLTLTLMLGTLFQGRMPTLGIPIAFIIIQVFLLRLLENVASWLPYLFPGALSELAQSVVLEQTMPSNWVLPIFTTILLSVLFIYIAIRRFRLEDL